MAPRYRDLFPNDEPNHLRQGPQHAYEVGFARGLLTALAIVVLVVGCSWLLGGCVVTDDDQLGVSTGWLGNQPTVRLHIMTADGEVEVDMDPQEAIDFGESLIEQGRRAQVLTLESGDGR